MVRVQKALEILSLSYSKIASNTNFSLQHPTHCHLTRTKCTGRYFLRNLSSYKLG